jgi:acetyltransferase-like isoleucine patch superfamily enzyme
LQRRAAILPNGLTLSLELLRIPFRRMRRFRKRLRFRLWAARLKLELRRNGGRLVLEAPVPPDFDSLPRIRAVKKGEGSGTFTLRLGTGVHFGHGVVLEIWAEGTNVLEIGDHSLLHGCIIQLRSGSITCADHVQIRDFTVVKSYGDLRMGSGVIVNYSCFIHCERDIVLEDLAAGAERVTIIDSDKDLTGGDDFFNDRPSLVDPVRIGRNTFMAAGVVITRGVTIGPNCAIAANAVVTRGDYPRGWLLGGVPARPLKDLFG